MQKKPTFIINKSEITAGTRGASLGPEAILSVARSNGSDLFSVHKPIWIKDVNDVLDSPVKHTYAKRIAVFRDLVNNLAETVSTTINQNDLTIVLAGDHGSAAGTVAGIKKGLKNKRLGVIWIDAHADIHSPFTTPSGNMHGMPVNLILGDDNLPCAKNQLSDELLTMWRDLGSHLGPDHVRPSDFTYIGMRDAESEELDIISRLGIINYKVEDVRSMGVEEILDRLKIQFAPCDAVYLSFDVDSMDPELTSHGTGTPVPVGLTPEEAAFFLQEVASWEKTVCIEFVEVNPCLDEKKNKMAEIAYKLINTVVNQVS